MKQGEIAPVVGRVISAYLNAAAVRSNVSLATCWMEDADIGRNCAAPDYQPS